MRIGLMTAARALTVVFTLLLPSPSFTQPADDIGSVFQRIVQLYQAGKYSEAVPFAERHVELTHARVGPQHPDYATSLYGLATLRNLTGRTVDAEANARQSLSIRERHFGPSHPAVADSLMLLADIERTKGRVPEREALVRRALAVRETSLGPEHAVVADTLATLAILCERPECTIEAESLYKRVIVIRDKALGPSNRLSVLSRFALAAFYWKNGRLNDAEPLYARTISDWESLFGADHQEFGFSLYSLGEVTRALGRLDDANRLHLRALTIHEKILPAGAITIVAGISALAMIAYNQSRYEDATQYYERILRIKASDPDVSWALQGLADSHYALGQYSKAEPLYKQAIDALEKDKGPDHPYVADLLNNLANLYKALGRYFDVEPLHKRALAIKEQKLGSAHHSVAVSLHNLADLYQYLGRYQEAQQLERRALDIKEKTVGPNHPEVAQSLMVLAYIYGNLGRYDDAEPLVLRANEVYEKAPENWRASRASALQGLAAIRQFQRKYTEAESLLRRAIELEETALGLGHPNLASSYNALANFLDEQGRASEATDYLEKALLIGEKNLGNNHPEVLWTRASLALRAAENDANVDIEPLIAHLRGLAEQRIGATHPALVSPFIRVGRTYIARQDWPTAYRYLKRASEIARQQDRYFNDRSVLSGNKPAWSEFQVPYAGALKAAYRLFMSTQDAAVPDEAFKLSQLVTQTDASKALGQMAVRFATGSGLLARLVRERQDLTNQRRAAERLLFLQKAARDDTNDPTRAAELTAEFATIEARLSTVSDQLTREFPEYAALAGPEPLSIAGAQAQLRDDEALIQFVEAPQVGNLPAEMFVWVITKQKWRWERSSIESKPLNDLVRALRCGLDRSQWYLQSAVDPTQCTELLGFNTPVLATTPLPFDLAKAHSLYQALLAPYEQLIGSKHLLIVASGNLATLPFQVLVTDAVDLSAAASDALRQAKWLIARQPITVLPSVGSLRALRLSARTSKATRPYAGFGNPLLDGDRVSPSHIVRASAARDRQHCRRSATNIAALPVQRVVVKRLARSGLANLTEIKSLLPLPETADEICTVGENLGALPTDLRLGEQATETEIKAMSENGTLATFRVLHFATHGALSGEIDGNAEPGLVLTPPAAATPTDDGYLSASEVATLKMDADWIILSACNTAAGATESAEALSGLARAFFYAGARSLLVSHWAVDSEPTVELITQAFAAMRTDPQIGRAEALRRSMTTMIAKGGSFAHPATWAPFAVVGEGGSATVVARATVEQTQKKPLSKPKSSKQGRPTPPDWRTEIFKH